MKTTLPFRARFHRALLIGLISFGGQLLSGSPIYGQCPPNVTCTPGSAPAGNLAFGMGIFRVTLAGLDTLTAGAIDGYQDYGCRSRPAQLVRGGTYTLAVQTNPNADETVRAWIDFDRDGIFSPAELVASPTSGRQHSASFTVPASAPMGTALRLRIAADYVNSPVPTACSSPQYSQTEDYRVIVLAAAPPRPVTRFTAADTITCSGTVAFHDQSRNSPTAWRWDFGDGSVSVQQHPQHTYALPGGFAVRLRTCNATGCDSLTKPNYVLFRATAPQPAPCTPATSTYCCGFGVTRVQLGATLDNPSADGAAGYEDFSCAQRATFTADYPTPLRITTGANAHDVRVYVDLNDNGQFDLPAELLYEGLGVQNPVVALRVATVTGLVYHRPLRLRLWVDAAGTAPFGPCTAPVRGQVEDYAVELLPNTAAPQAGFSLAYAQYCGPTRVTVANASVGGATSYSWDFGDGSTSSAAAPPAHSYPTGGVYDVTLVARNAFGTDTIRQTVAVATACPTYCGAAGTGGSVSSAAYFTRVQVANLDNTDVRPPGTGYWDYTTRAAELLQGGAYSLRAESPRWSTGGNGPWVRVTAWIDYNQDGNFVASERLGQVTMLSPYLLPFHVPLGSRVGATRLRVQIASLFQPTDPDNSCPPAYQTATTEDYTVLILPALQAPQAGFAADVPFSCSGTVQLRDTSLAAPRTWQWSFGDGSTSIQQHPQHTYAQPGTYSVSLQVTNRYGTSTVAKTNYLVISRLNNGPRPAACLPPAGPATSFPATVGTIQLGSWVYTNAVPYAPYRDETCGAPAVTLAPGSNTPVTLLSQPAYTGFTFQIWLDANDDGILDPATELVYNSNRHSTTVNPWTGLLHVPATALQGQPLRLRVWWMVNRIPPYTVVEDNPCYRHGQVGQVRDFTAFVGTATATTPGHDAAIPWAFSPNPTQGRITLTGAGQAQELLIWDAAGRLVTRRKLGPGNDQTVDLTALPKGLYVARVAGRAGTQKLLIW